MVVPWVGFPLHKLLALVEPTSNARYVAFKTLYAPEQMPGQKDRFIGGGLAYPYVEGLRLDEAMHPLTLTQRWRLWQSAAAAKRCAHPPDRAVEVRL